MSLIPVVPENYTHVLAEFDCLDPLLSALRLDSGRLKVDFPHLNLVLVFSTEFVFPYYIFLERNQCIIMFKVIITRIAVYFQCFLKEHGVFFFSLRDQE